jgi:ParB/RepB/Spo0J family partition protein
MPSELVQFERLEKALPIKDLEIADENVRKRSIETDIEGLKESIREIGLIHPVIVLPRQLGKYQLIVGQRRLRAFIELGRGEIPALILGKDIDSEDRKRVSFAENNQRRRLPYKDTIELCNALYARLRGSSTQRVKKIGVELGISEGTVLKYLSYWLVPEDVQNLVARKLLTRAYAYKITRAYWPSSRLIFEMAKRAVDLTGDERERVVELAPRSGSLSPDDIIEAAKKPYPVSEVVVYLDPETKRVLDEEAGRRQTDLRTLVRTILEDWATEESRDDGV